jgi:hypothetical protein
MADGSRGWRPPGAWDTQAIENGLHHVRDTTFAQNRSWTRASTPAQVMATFRNLAIDSHRPAGVATIAQTTRAIAGRPEPILPSSREDRVKKPIGEARRSHEDHE